MDRDKTIARLKKAARDLYLAGQLLESAHHSLARGTTESDREALSDLVGADAKLGGAKLASELAAFDIRTEHGLIAALLNNDPIPAGRE